MHETYVHAGAITVVFEYRSPDFILDLSAFAFVVVVVVDGLWRNSQEGTKET